MEDDLQIVGDWGNSELFSQSFLIKRALTLENICYFAVYFNTEISKSVHLNKILSDYWNASLLS